jgi:Fe-S-cluster containining protein
MTDLPVLESCDDCGACCMHMVAPPFVINAQRNEPEEKGVPENLLSELLPRWQTRLVVPESACCWFDADSLRCRHYDIRPDACRDFAINSPSCHASRAKWGVGNTP